VATHVVLRLSLRLDKTDTSFHAFIAFATVILN